jgi:predicted phosphodiesterase
MIAILSDIHGNLEALEAVLADIDQHKVESVYCLGDVIGYGPNPLECIDLTMRFCMTVLGNHDHAALFDPMGFSATAERAIFWTRDQLEEPIGSREWREKRWEFLAERPYTHRDVHGLFVHGSVRNPLSEYVFPEDVYNQRKMERIFPLVERHCFQGHTHIPGIYVEQFGDERYRFISPEEVGNVYMLDEHKTLINVGSVGQPRDGNWRASYVLLDGNRVMFRRVEYAVDQTVSKIHAIPELDRMLGDRLWTGQ